MNKYQKLINQITKDDLKKDLYSSFLKMDFRRHRRIVRFGMKGITIPKLIEYRNFNRTLNI